MSSIGTTKLYVIITFKTLNFRFLSFIPFFFREKWSEIGIKNYYFETWFPHFDDEVYTAHEDRNYQLELAPPKIPTINCIANNESIRLLTTPCFIWNSELLKSEINKLIWHRLHLYSCVIFSFVSRNEKSINSTFWFVFSEW